MLRVCQQVALIVQYLERSFFIISYFGFEYTTVYNSILFCCLRRNVEPCCHTHDSWTTVTVYSARTRLVGLALYTVTDDGDCLQRVTLVVQYPQSTKTGPLSAINSPRCSSYRSQSQIFVQNRDFSLPDLRSTPLLGQFPSEYCHDVWYGKTDGGKSLKICLFIFTKCTNLTDRHTHTHIYIIYRRRMTAQAALAQHHAAKTENSQLCP